MLITVANQLRIHQSFEVTNSVESRVNENERSFERSFEQSLSEVLSEAELERIMPIINYLRRHGSISPKEAKELTGKSSATEAETE